MRTIARHTRLWLDVSWVTAIVLMGLPAMVSMPLSAEIVMPILGFAILFGACAIVDGGPSRTAARLASHVAWLWRAAAGAARLMRRSARAG